MTFLNKIGWVLTTGLKKFDLFSTTQFIKFNKESQYKTATGGFVSLVLITIIIILFSSKGLRILDRSIINSSISTQIDTDPSQLTVITSIESGFMFSVGIYSMNLNDPNVTYFNISLSQNSYSPILQIINTVQVPLVPCMASHFAFNDKILQQYQKFNFSQYLCPPIGYEFDVEGRLTSQKYSQFTINVQKCNSSKIANCASDSVMQTLLSSLGSFTLVVPFVNTIVNPNNQQYLQTFLEDRNYFTFTPNYGVSVNAQISQYEIHTDISIMPYEKIVTEFITTIPTLFNSRSTQVIDNLYASITFSKSGTTVTYQRSFSKIDDYLSYIGGLIGTSLVMFCVLSSYSEHSFFVDLASKILLIENPQFSFSGFNFLFYIGVTLKNALNSIKIDINWEKGDLFIRSIEEMKEQLDIRLLMKKILFLQEAVSSILSEHQLDALYLKDKRSFAAMTRWREKHKIAQIISLDYLWHLQNSQTTAIRLKNEEEMNVSSMQCNKNRDDEIFLLQKMKQNIEKVVNESKHNDLISQRILNKLASEAFQKADIQQGAIKQQIELKQLLKENISSQIRTKKSRNAVSNEYQTNKQKQKNKEIAIINMQD